jgi:hypothetical protein
LVTIYIYISYIIYFEFAVKIVTVGIRALVWVQEWKKKRGFNKFLTYQDGSHEEGCDERRRA